jgi:hypothetical protein
MTATYTWDVFSTLDGYGPLDSVGRHRIPNRYPRQAAH